MSKTYRHLLEELQKLTPEQLDMTATVFVPGIDEFYPVDSICYGNPDENDVLDADHPFLTL